MSSSHVGYRGIIDIYNTPAELDPSDPTAQIALTMNPITLYVRDAGGTYQVLSAASAPPASSPASESALGTVELATESEVQAGTAGVLVATVARLKAELDRRGTLLGAAATETERGTLELATTAEAQAGTLTGAYAMNPARVREAITPEAWIALTLLNGWSNLGSGVATAGYRRRPGERCS
jgi:hypothetical protein